MKQKFEDFTYRSGQIPHGLEDNLPPPGHYRLSQAVDFEALLRKLNGGVGPEEKVVRSKSREKKDKFFYIDDSMDWLKEHECQVFITPPDNTDFAIIKNWIAFRGYTDNLAMFGYDKRFMMNTTVIRAPLLMISRKLLVKMNAWYKEHSTSKRRAYKLKEFQIMERARIIFRATYETCCVGYEPTIQEFLDQADDSYITPFSDMIMMSDMFTMGHHLFHRVPESDLMCVPLQPRPGLKLPGLPQYKWSCDFGKWDLIRDSKIVHLEDDHER